MVDNVIHRYAIHNTDPLVAQGDVLIIYVQPTPPTELDKQANWLPTPTTAFVDCPDFANHPECLDFNLSLRIYGPQSSVLKGKWHPPWVVQVDTPEP